MNVMLLLKKTLPEELELLKEFHALMVKHGKERCKSKPLCGSCQLHDVCFHFKAEKVRGMYSIGYSRLKFCDFIQKLKENQIQVLIDVRRFPKSSITDYEGISLEEKLSGENIQYVHVPELGGFRGGYKDYMESELFHSGIEKMLAYSQDRISCIMCMEDDPKYCHRRYIAETLNSLDMPVHHIKSK